MAKRPHFGLFYRYDNGNFIQSSVCGRNVTSSFKYLEDDNWVPIIKASSIKKTEKN